MIPMHLSDEQSVNSTMMMVGGLGRGAFRMARWLARHRKRLEKPDKGNELLKDALSVYRGGEMKGSGSEEALKDLIRDLSGTRDISAGEQFIFTGEKTDLSFFWKREGGGAAILPKSSVMAIPDEVLRDQVSSILAEGVLAGSLAEGPSGWSLTRKGEQEIYRMDFVKERLKSELVFSEAALGDLSAEKERILHDRIDTALLKAGIDPARYEGYNRATLNKQTLFVREFDDQIQFHIPGTGRRGGMLIPKSDLFDLNEKTYAVFLHPEKAYFISEKPGAIKRVSGQELFARLEDKNKKDLARLKTIVEAKGDNLALVIDPSRAGESWLICDRHLNDFVFTAKGEAILPSGTEVIVLDGMGRGDFVMPKSAIDTVAVPQDQAEAFLQIRDPEKVAAFWEAQSGLDSQLPESGELMIRAGSFSETAEAYEVQTAGSGFEHVVIAKSDGRMLPDGSLAVRIREDSALLRSGQYSQTITKDGTQAVLKVYGGTAMGKAAGISAAIPAVDPVSAGAKAVMQAAGGAAQAAGQAIGLSQSRH